MAGPGFDMRTLNDAVDQLGYHPATPDVAPKYATLRQAAIDLASDTWDLIPDGPEKTLALRGLQQWLMYANLAVALTVPLDLDTAHVARVLPEPVDVESASRERCMQFAPGQSSDWCHLPAGHAGLHVAGKGSQLTWETADAASI